jgi:uncharacterized protein (TIGR03067 family)
MRYLTLALAMAVAAALTCHAFAGGDDAKKLAGTWQITELIVGGMKVPDKDIAGMKFVFSKDKDGGDQLEIVPPTADTGIVEKRTFKLKFDAAKKPATFLATALDGEFKGTSSPGIFDFTGDVLRWCQSDDPKATEAPKDFTSPEKSSIYVFTFKRAK